MRMIIALTLEFCREMVLTYKTGKCSLSSKRLVNLLILPSSFLTTSIHLLTEAGLPSYELVSEVDNFHKLSVNEKYQFWAEFNTEYTFYFIAEKGSVTLRWFTPSMRCSENNLVKSQSVWAFSHRFIKKSYSLGPKGWTTSLQDKTLVL